MEMDKTKLGFSRLRVIHCNNNIILEMCKQVGNDLYLSSQLCKSMLICKQKPLGVIHGPCDKKYVSNYLNRIPNVAVGISNDNYMLLLVKLQYNCETALCHHVVGSEETVKTRRMLHTMRDNLLHNKVYNQITSGSSGEGLEMKGNTFQE
jgi:hypothetical protein